MQIHFFPSLPFFIVKKLSAGLGKVFKWNNIRGQHLSRWAARNSQTACEGFLQRALQDTERSHNTFILSQVKSLIHKK